MQIIIGADICITPTIEECFSRGSIEEYIDEDIIGILSRADYRIFNLEGPVVDGGIAIDKCGPNLKMSPKSFGGISRLHPDLITLANNHIMDYGSVGYESTIEILNKYCIDYVGVGSSVYEMKKAHFIEVGDKIIAIYACAEHEFSIAEDDKPGANAFDPLETFDDIAKLKEKSDYIVVLYHGGKERYRFPSPYQQRVFRKMAEKGANLVISQHTHCVGCVEKYKNSTLIYGQGNFIFDSCDDEYWNSGLLVQLDVSDDMADHVSYIPFVKQGGMIHLDSKYGRVLKGFEERSISIKNPSYIAERYDLYVKENEKNYLAAIAGDSVVIRILRKLFGISFYRYLYNKTAANRLYDYLICESHNDLLKQVVNLFRSP